MRSLWSTTREKACTSVKTPVQPKINKFLKSHKGTQGKKVRLIFMRQNMTLTPKADESFQNQK